MSDFDAYSILPGRSSLRSREEVDLTTRIARKVVARLPLVASPMNSVTEYDMAMAIANLGGVGVIHRYMPVDEQAEQVLRFKANAPKGWKVGAAIGLTNKEGRVDALIEAEADFLMGDVANGWTQSAIDLLDYIKQTYGDHIQVISGNIATKEAAEEFYVHDVDGFRVGIGAGSVCITRRVAGVGRNQLVAIQEIHEAFPGTPVSSCGGIRFSGDVVKALAFGAESVVIGRLFAACDESPAKRLADGRIVYAGMASYFAEQVRLERTGEDPADIFHLASPEGKEDLLDPVGPLKDLVLGNPNPRKPIPGLVPGIQTGLAYLGARDIQEFQKVVRWERV